MVQGTRVRQIILGGTKRILALSMALLASAYVPINTLYFMENTLGYQRSSGFFGFSIEHLVLSFIMTFILWVGIFFGALGTKIDYWIIGGFLILALIIFQGLSVSMYLGLIGVAVLGNALGYMLKLGRQKWFPKKAL